jgi:hypothetical protein
MKFALFRKNMNNLNVEDELRDETGESISAPDIIGSGVPFEEFSLFSSVIGTDIQSVNLKKVMTTVSDVKGGENPDEINENPNVVNSGLPFPENTDSDREPSANSVDLKPGFSDDSSPADVELSTVRKAELPSTEIKEHSEIPVSVQTEDVILEEEDEEVVEKDFGHFSKEELVNELQSILNGENIKALEKIVDEIRNCFEELVENEKKAALENFISKGGKESDFKVVNSKIDNRFEALMNRYRSRKASFLADLGKQKDTNLQKKHLVLESLRKLVDSEETTTSIGALKKIQQEWKAIGPVQNQHVKSLWASYNALMDRFYDKRSIYFELKELDRRKNLEAKIEICEKAEKLTKESNIRDAIKELNELHDEFKHLGPVPSDQQEVIWQRFKTASDQIYSRRKDFLHEIKKSLLGNLEQKKALIEELEKFRDFNNESIVEWNIKTREILDIQKKWEALGGIPKEHTKAINKNFWSAFKTFFGNKNKFFKKLEGKREENLKLKEELINKAIALKDSDDWVGTANKLKELQNEWKNVGPVPEKHKTEIFDRFKQTCDEFFNKRRTHSKEVEVEYVNNLQKKEDICLELEKMISDNALNIERFQVLQSEYEQIGYVPRNAIKKIQKRFSTISEKFYELADVSDERKNELKFSAEINKLKSSPDSDRKLQRKEIELRKMINKLENDIAIWRNNLDFFKESDTADKLRAEFNIKIEKALGQLNELKEELKVIIKI